jgi:diguanylate cyclase
MRYTQDRDSSAELLRLVLQKMSGQPAAFSPFNYTLWYEFVVGINPGLTQAINDLLNCGKKLDDATVARLYDEHIARQAREEKELLQREIKDLLNKLAGFTAETNKQASLFGDSLEKYGDSLKSLPDAKALQALIGGMLGDTDKMKGSVQNLNQQLEASRQEVERLHQELQSARGEALKDPLTGVNNRRGFDKHVQEIMEDEVLRGRGVSMLMVDIDHFKKINDTYGHLFGDKVIRALATILTSKVKGQDVVARFGGEEFAVFLPDTQAAGARTLAEQIRLTIQNAKIRRLDTQEQIGGITISIGVSELRPGVSITELVDEADKALYASKTGGRNRTTIFTQ